MICAFTIIVNKILSKFNTFCSYLVINLLVIWAYPALANIRG